MWTRCLTGTLVFLYLAAFSCVPVSNNDLPPGSPSGDDDTFPVDETASTTATPLLSSPSPGPGDDDATTPAATPGDDDSTTPTTSPLPPTASPSPPVDADGDGFPDGVDCDDSDPAVYPGALELCNGVDNDCDGQVDHGLPDSTYWQDADGDGHGDPDLPIVDCLTPTAASTANDDCDDTDAFTYPGAPESCDDKDNDCDGKIDEDVAPTTYYRDQDGDGWGTKNDSVTDCKPPGESYVLTAGDCNDEDPAIHPGVDEVCDGIDNDCDGEVDEGLTTPYFLDWDGDGFGDDSGEQEACAPPVGYVDMGGDCNDHSASQHPMVVDPKASSPQDGTFDHPLSSIQEAIDSNQNCGMVLLRPGTYREPIDLSNKTNFVLKALETADTTTIESDGGKRAVVAADATNLTVQGITFHARDVVDGDGAAVYVARGSDITFQGVHIAESWSNSTDGCGGGIAVLGTASLAVMDATIENNTADYGAGVCCRGCTLWMSNTVVRGQKANRRGGGLYVTNDEVNPGEVHIVDGCVFSENIAENYGGGASADEGSLLEIEDATFTENTVSSYLGGAVHNPYLVQHCVFAWNHASEHATTAGGALGIQGPVTVMNSLFVENDGYIGGAILVDAFGLNGSGDPMYIINNTFFGNTTPTWDSTAIYVADGGALIFRNNIVVSRGSYDQSAVYILEKDSFTIDYNDVFVESGVAYRGPGTKQLGDGNIAEDPLFFSEDTSSLDTWDFHFPDRSPCHDAGTGDSDPDGSATDMGAYGGPGGAW